MHDNFGSPAGNFGHRKADQRSLPITVCGAGLLQMRAIRRAILDSIRAQVQRLRQGQQIWIDGQLEDEAWAEAAAVVMVWHAFTELWDLSQVPWLENFMDLAGPRHRSARTAQAATPQHVLRPTASMRQETPAENVLHRAMPFS